MTDPRYQQRVVCPLDQQPLQFQQGAWRCASGHSFDVAKQGYLNLLPVQQKRSRDPGDSKAMVAARKQVLDSGTYQPIVNALLQQLQPVLEVEQAVEVVDAGCGEGYYLQQIQQRFPQHHYTGFDISKWAVTSAARRSREIGWLVASSKNPPLRAQQIDLLLCLFGFYSFAGFAQLLKPGGRLLLLDPGPRHLIEMREIIYPEVRHTALPSIEQAEEYGFQLDEELGFEAVTPVLDQQQLSELLLMTPHMYKAPAEGKDKLAQLDELQLTLDLNFRWLIKR